MFVLSHNYVSVIVQVHKGPFRLVKGILNVILLLISIMRNSGNVVNMCSSMHTT